MIISTKSRKAKEREMRKPLVNSIMTVLIASVCGLDGVTAQPTRTESIVAKREVDGRVVQSERDEQQALYNYYFRNRKLKYVTKLAKLKTEATVPSWRIPYSAAIHPEASGGLSSTRVATRRGLFGRIRPAVSSGGGSSALMTYDRAFNGGSSLANAYELKRLMGSGTAIFPALRMRRNAESWEGYCSGFTASTIKHPEPVKAVDAGDFGGTRGVTLQPADIKALLSCIYNRTTDDSYLYLAPPSANDGGPNMGCFHLTLTNYIGVAGHPVGWDRTKGEVAWNNPIYRYKVNSMRDAGSEAGFSYKEVETTVTYTYYGSDYQRQTDLESGERVGNTWQSMTLRYLLALDKRGEIVGGRALTSSGHFLWIPLYPVQATRDGSVPGNPYIDVNKVIALARASAIPKLQRQFDKATVGPRVDPNAESD
jgi:hypothetical protein